MIKPDGLYLTNIKGIMCQGMWQDLYMLHSGDLRSKDTAKRNTKVKFDFVVEYRS